MVDAQLAQTSIIDTFLDSYERQDGSALSDVDRGLVRCALEDFLLDEWWLRMNSGHEAFLADIAVLGERVAGQTSADVIVRRVTTGIETLAARLDRIEHALMVQREHAMMLSEGLKRERG